jgi:lysophospholipase L1-like esterase
VKEKSPLRPREVWIRTGLVAASAALALAAGEIALRLLNPPQPSIRFQQRQENSRRIRRLDIASVIENDPELFWRLAPGRRMPEDGGWARGVISNRQSLREDHEIPRAKPPGETRILFLGDSCTFGTGLLHHEGFVDRVEQRLRARYGLPVECINAGVPGYSLFQGWRFLETRGLGLEPDLVVLTFGWNDRSEWDGLGDRRHFEALRAARPPAPLRWSRTAALAWAAFAGRQEPENATERRPRVLPEEFRSLLGEIHGLIRRRGVDLLLLVWPGRFNVDPAPTGARTAYQIALYEYGERELRFGPEGESGHLDLVALVQRLRARHSPDELFLDHVHGTRLTNDAIAAAIVEKIGPWFESR